MIQITQLRVPVGSSEKELKNKIRKMLRLKPDENFSYRIVKRSVDARKKPDLLMVYTVEVSVQDEKRILKNVKISGISQAEHVVYRIPSPGEAALHNRPVVIGAGPAGLFAAYVLTEAGFAPLVLERGKAVEDRQKDVEKFWETGILDTQSNVQFGEGGAGAFSDGKLNTSVKDPTGKNRFVLETFVRFGASSDILIDAKPHIGTDVLAKVIANMRSYMIEKGARFCYQTRVDDLEIENGRITGVILDDRRRIACDAVILAVGHSARDTFEMLYRKNVPMEAKNFAVGFRVEHPQKMIDLAMYGRERGNILPASPYKVTANFPNGRGVYSFCMCPGGYVVNASSENGGTCVNGMSYSGRNGSNANSAVIVSVGPQDFGGNDPLAGVRFQRALEHKVYELGKGAIPQQLYGDFCQKSVSSAYGAFESQTKGKTVFAPLNGLLNPECERAFMDGMAHFAHIIPDFDRADAILSGMESRTSSPLRILRSETCESTLMGLYPCGEGAGFAGGITSAAIDGIRTAENVIRRYHP